MEKLLEEWAHVSGRSRPQFLIVDDQAINIRVLHELFRKDVDVFMATNGQQALEMTKSLLPDMILLDVMMKEPDGHEVCRQLKADPLTTDIPVIFITAQNLESDEAYGFELGAVDFITKPFNPVIVKARAKTHLAMKLQSDLLRAIATHDGLTGVANRRRFDEVLDLQWRQSLREKTPISLIMIDIDYFKKYNDLYGHQAGDICLKTVAQAVQSILGRPFDFFARYGGEEFACILPNTHINGAQKVAQAILLKIESLKIEHKASEVAPIVTASLGIITIVAASQSKKQLFIESADKQLYLAKDGGRNQFCSTEVLHVSGDH